MKTLLFAFSIALSLFAEQHEELKRNRWDQPGFLVVGKNVRETFQMEKVLENKGFRVIGADEGTPFFVYSSLKKEDMEMILNKSFDMKSISLKSATPKSVDWRKDFYLSSPPPLEKKYEGKPDFYKSKGLMIVVEDDSKRAEMRDVLHYNGYTTMGMDPDRVLVLPER